MTEFQQAVTALVRAGRRDEVVRVMTAAADAAHRRYDNIKEDQTRTGEWRASALADTYATQRAALESELIRLAAGVQRTERSDARAVFGVDDLPGDAASLAISRRDAADRIEREAASGGNLGDLLTRATRNGDEVLARAIAEHAIDAGNSALLDRFMADRPALVAAAQRVWDAAQHEDQGTLGLMIHMAAMRPQ